MAATPEMSGATELTVVLMAGGRSNALYPLTEETPLSLLPVANRPLLSYQLEMLSKCGTKHVMVVVGRSAAAEIRRYLETVELRKMKVTLEVGEDDVGSAEALRSVADKIKTDFAIVSGDLISDAKLQHAADMHRMKDATLTMLLAPPAKTGGDAKGKKKGATEAMEGRDVVGLVEADSRIVFLASGADVEDDEGLTLRKPLLRRFPQMAVRSSLMDTHVYIFARWVLDLLVEKTTFTSIKAHLVPFLVNKQFRRKTLAALAPLATPDLALMGIEPQALNASLESPTTARSGGSAGGAGGLLQLPHQSSMTMMASGPVSPAEVASDTVRCHYCVAADGAYARRIISLDAYTAANRDVPSKSSVLEFKPPVPPSQRFQFVADSVELDNINAVGSESCVGDGTTLADGATVKKSNVGAHCSLAAAAKVVNSVVMDHVTVGADTVITGSVVGTRAVIGAGVSLTACRVASGAVVADGVEGNNRVFSAASYS